MNFPTTKKLAGAMCVALAAAAAAPTVASAQQEQDERVTEVRPRQAGGVRGRGLLNSGIYPYDPRFAAAADLRFRCDVDYRGYVRDVDINRRR